MSMWTNRYLHYIKYTLMYSEICSLQFDPSSKYTFWDCGRDRSIWRKPMQTRGRTRNPGIQSKTFSPSGDSAKPRHHDALKRSRSWGSWASPTARFLFTGMTSFWWRHRCKVSRGSRVGDKEQRGRTRHKKFIASQLLGATMRRGWCRRRRRRRADEAVTDKGWKEM